MRMKGRNRQRTTQSAKKVSGGLAVIKLVMPAAVPSLHMSPALDQRTANAERVKFYSRRLVMEQRVRRAATSVIRNSSACKHHVIHIRAAKSHFL